MTARSDFDKWSEWYKGVMNEWMSERLSTKGYNQSYGQRVLQLIRMASPVRVGAINHWVWQLGGCEWWEGEVACGCDVTEGRMVCFVTTNRYVTTSIIIIYRKLDFGHSCAPAHSFRIKGEIRVTCKVS